MFKVINAITNDLNMYMWGSSIRKGGVHGLPFDPDVAHALHSPINIVPRDRPWPYDALNREPVDDTKAMRIQKGRERIVENGRGGIDCGKFKKDLKDVCV